MAEQMQPMPDVPERCPECGSTLSQKFERGYHLAWYKCNSILFCTGRFQQSLACLQNQRDALRAEAERYRQQYDALEADVVRELIEAATRYLAATTRESDDDPNCWAEEEFAEARLREVLAKVRGEA